VAEELLKLFMQVALSKVELQMFAEIKLGYETSGREARVISAVISTLG